MKCHWYDLDGSQGSRSKGKRGTKCSEVRPLCCERGERGPATEDENWAHEWRSIRGAPARNPGANLDHTWQSMPYRRPERWWHRPLAVCATPPTRPALDHRRHLALGCRRPAARLRPAACWPMSERQCLRLPLYACQHHTRTHRLLMRRPFLPDIQRFYYTQPVLLTDAAAAAIGNKKKRRRPAAPHSSHHTYTPVHSSRKSVPSPRQTDAVPPSASSRDALRVRRLEAAS